MSNLQKAIDALIRKGRHSGQLTHDEIIEALSSFDLCPDTFDQLLERLVNEGVEVVDDDQSEDYYASFVAGPENWDPEPAGIEFDASARELLKWATWIALCSDAQEVDRDHLVAAVRAERPPPEPRKVWDIPFSSTMQSGLARACSGTTPVGRHHILSAFGFKFTVADALGKKVREMLEKRGIDTSELWRQLGDFEAHYCVPRPGFSKSEAGRRWHKFASQVANQRLGQELGFLLLCILTNAPASAILTRSGVSEELVLSLLEDLPAGARPPFEISADVRQLLKGEPLSIESLRSLELAWRCCCDREQIRPDDLLPTLLVYGTQAGLILESLGALKDIVAAFPTRVRIFEDLGSKPKLSPELRTVLDIARAAAGDSLVETGHLLLGLADFGHPLVAHLKEQIRDAL